MKKVISIVTIFILVIGIMSCSGVFAATENDGRILDKETESKIVQMKENSAKSMEDYKIKYGSEAYGTVAYILNLVRIFSIPLCFLGIAIGAIHQYIIGIRKLDTLEKVSDIEI